jgi:hypothetical protein
MSEPIVIRSFMTFIIGHLAYESLRNSALDTIELSDYYWAIRSRRPNMFSRIRKLFLLSIVAVLLTTAISACSTSKSSDVHLIMMPMDQMPADVQSAPVAVQQAYQFASINPDIMKDIPCYCGCGDIGHTSNYDCYVSEVDASGKIAFDNHALGCSICVDITQDVMRMLREGKSPQEARTYVDATYSKYGPSNIP